MKTKAVKSFTLLIATLLCSLFCFGCTKTSEAMKLVGEPAFTCVYNEETKQYDVVVDGIAKNIEDEDLTYVYVKFALYDENHHLIGLAVDSIDLVLAEENWRYCATDAVYYPVASVEFREFY